MVYSFIIPFFKIRKSKNWFVSSLLKQEQEKWEKNELNKKQNDIEQESQKNAVICSDFYTSNN